MDPNNIQNASLTSYRQLAIETLSSIIKSSLLFKCLIYYFSYIDIHLRSILEINQNTI